MSVIAYLRIHAALGVALALFFATTAWAQDRVALVIGNSAYRHAPRLPNPVNDADAVSLLLKSAGFTVVETRHDLGGNEMRRAIRDFSDKMRNADMAVVYYAGHGIEVDASNYLVPVDAVLQRDIDVEDETISLNRVLQIIEPAKRLRLVILDACRDNPFAKTMKRTMSTRAIGRGLASVEPTTSNTLSAFAAKGGSTVDDGGGSHSPFTTALLNNIATPGLDLRIAFGRVRDQVLQSTGGKQEPFVYGSLGGSTVALVSPSGESLPASIGSNSGDQTWRDYEAAAQIGTKDAWDSFLGKYPTGFYADLARVQRTKLMASLPAPTAAPVGPKAGTEQKKGAKPDVGPSDINPAEMRKSNLAQFSRHQGCYKYRSAAECEASRRVMRNAIARGKAAQDYAGATYCGCGP